MRTFEQWIHKLEALYWPRPYLVNIEDWTGFTWFAFDWCEDSKPMICIRFRFFKRAFHLIYFRNRPEKYRKASGPPYDKKFILEGLYSCEVQ